MSTDFFYAWIGAGLFSLGLHALIMHAHLLRKILAVNVMGSGVFLVLVALANRSTDGTSDAVPQAMVITGIVVAVSATALALTLMLKLSAATGCATLSDDQRD